MALAGPVELPHAKEFVPTFREPNISPPFWVVKRICGGITVSINGLIAFFAYIIRIYVRWARITVARYGLKGLLDPSYRPERGVPQGRHRVGVWAVDVIRQLEQERALP